MNRFLALALTLMSGCVAYAANPSFQSFNTNQFDVTGNRVAVAAGVPLTNAFNYGVSVDSSVTEVPASTLTSVGSVITVSFTNAALYNHTLSADVTLAISDTGSATNRLIYLDLYTDGTHTITWPAGAVLPATTNQPFFSGVGGKVSVLIERTSSPGGGITNYISWTPALVGPADLTPEASQLWTNISGAITAVTGSPAFQGLRYVPSLNRLILQPDGVDTNSYSQISIGVEDSTFASQIYDTLGNPWTQSFYQYRVGSSVHQVFLMGLGSDYYTLLDPNQDFAGTPYVLNTVETVSSGNLLEVKNNSTNIFVVPWDGIATIPSLIVNENISVKGNANINTLIVTNTITINGNLAATYAGITNVMTWALSDMTTALTTGTNKNYWYAPAAGMTIKWVRATVALTSSSGTPTFDINEAGTSILSTKITIDANEFDSLDATTAPVISDTAIAAKAKIDFDIDVAGTAAAGAQIQIGFTVP